MKFKITSKVYLFGMQMKDEYIQEFADDSNVFGRVLDYHERMKATFPECQYKLIEAKEITERIMN